jgi:hypothetical protein
VSAEVPSKGCEKLDIELTTVGEVQFTDAGPPPPVLWIGEEVIALTPKAACAGAETKMGAIKANAAVIT